MTPIKTPFNRLFEGVTAYMIVALVWDFERAIPLLVIWSLVVGYNIYAQIRNRFGDKISVFFEPGIAFFIRHIAWFKW